MLYTRVYADDTGESHFEDLNIEFHGVDFAPPAPPMLLSPYVDVNRFALLSCPTGWYGDWHPAPHRQWMLILSGMVGVEVSDGEVREMTAETILLLEDTVGRGHRSWQIGDEPFVIAVIQIPDPDVPPH